MTEAIVVPDRRGFRAPGTTFMVVGGLLGALLAYVFQFLGGRALGTDEFAPVGVLWTAFFILATVLLIPVEQYVTRDVSAGGKAFPHVIRPALVMAGVGAVIGLAFVGFTLDDLFQGDPQYLILIVLLMVAYALLMIAKGLLAGRRRFADVGWVLIIEGLGRLIAGMAAIAWVGTATSLGWAMVVGPACVLLLGWWRHDKGDPDHPVTPAVRFLSGYAGGTASSQLLLAGAPIAVAALGGSPAAISITFFTFTIFRAPLTLIFSLQGRILPFLVGLVGDDSRTRLARIARLVFIGGVALAVLGGLVGWLIGPDVMRLLLGEEFMPSQMVAMLAAGGVMAAAAAQITSQVLVAEGRTSRLAWAWLSGLVVGVVVMFLASGAAENRVATGFAAGELTALSAMAFLAVRT